MLGNVGCANQSKAVLDVRPSFLPCLFARLSARSKLRRWRLVRWRHLEEQANIHTKRRSQPFQQIDGGVEATVLERAYGRAIDAGVDRQMLLADATSCSGGSEIPSYSITNFHARMPRILISIYPSDISDIIIVRRGSAYLPTTESPTPTLTRTLPPADRIPCQRNIEKVTYEDRYRNYRNAAGHACAAAVLHRRNGLAHDRRQSLVRCRRDRPHRRLPDIRRRCLCVRATVRVDDRVRDGWPTRAHGGIRVSRPTSLGDRMCHPRRHGICRLAGCQEDETEIYACSIKNRGVGM